MSEQPHDAPVEDVQDDEIIGRALRWSLVAFALIALTVGAFVVIGGREAPRQTVEDALLEGPLDTAPGADPVPPPLPFSDVTAEAGIDFLHHSGAYGDRLLPETMGSGAAFFDYDNDGDPDLLLVDATTWPWRSDAAERAGTRLYANRGDGTFEDVSAATGFTDVYYGTGVAIGDVDNDGFKDVFVAAVGDNRLYMNRGGERFERVDAGLEGVPDEWSSAAAFLDSDNDGDLDLFVANYVKWSKEIDFEVDYRLTGVGRAYGPPTNYEGTQSRLYENVDGAFRDVSEWAGVYVDNPATGAPMGKGLAVTILDVDGDGWTDVMVANDTVQNFLFMNLGNGRFEERGALYGVAFDNGGAATGAMGIDAARYANNDDLGIAVGNFANEMTSFYVAQAGSGLFTDEGIVSGIGAPSRRALSFGVFFFDADLDGRLDFLQANGHVEDEINAVQPSQQFEQPTQLFWNCGLDCRSQFVLVDPIVTRDLATPLVGRGATYADIDADGDLDVLITQPGRRPHLFRNDQSVGHNWLRLHLSADGPNRDAIGARVTVTTPHATQHRFLTPAKSYLSSVEFPLTIGLGEAVSADVTVRWPDGTAQAFGALDANRRHVLRKGP